MSYWARIRKVFRWCRLLLLSLVLFTALALLYLNKIGLPSFLKSRIISQLEAQGLNVEFSRLRLAGFREVRIENVTFGILKEKNSPRLFIDAADLNLSWAGLLSRRFAVEGLQIKRGRFVWPFSDAGGPSKSFRLEDIVTELKFAPGDRWDLIDFRANVLGAKVYLGGSITNASAIPSWGSPSTNQAGNSWEPYLRNVVNTLEHLEYPSQPELTLKITGDAKDLSSFKARLHLVAPSAITPWGKVRQLDLDSTLEPNPQVPGHVQTTLLLKFDDLRTASGVFEYGSAKSQTSYAYTNAPVLYSRWNVSVRKATVATGFAEQLNFELKTTQNTNEQNTHLTTVDARAAQISFLGTTLANPILRARVITRLPDVEFFSGVSSLWSSNWMTNLALIKQGGYEAQATQVTVNEAQAEMIRLSGTFQPSTREVLFTDLKSVVNGFGVDFQADFSGLSGYKVPVRAVTAIGRWNYPEIRIETIKGTVYGESFLGDAALNTSSSILQISVNSQFDLRKAKPLMPANLGEWVGSMNWPSPPQIKLSGGMILPSRWPGPGDWVAYSRTNLHLQGAFKMAEFTVKEIPFQAANAEFSWLNGKLDVPRMNVVLPGGNLRLRYSEDFFSDQFTFAITNSADPRAFRKLFAGDPQAALDQFVFRTPPLLEAEGGGSWTNVDNLYFHGTAAATNFVFRDEEWRSFDGGFRYTNYLINFDQISIAHGEGMISIPSGSFDFRRMLGFVTNADSTVEPSSVVKVLGPVVARAIAPYHFSKPPKVRINGTIPTDDPSKADLYFHVNGGPFNYWRFNVPEISGDIHWWGDLLTISNVQASFYNGHLDWEGGFHFKPDDSADFHFKAAVQHSDLKLLMKDLVKSTNQLEGLLKGNLVITAANSDDWKSWQGFGDAQLDRGFLWNVPIFGVFSSFLNTIAPGLGNNPASAAHGSFTVDKSVVYTHDLEVKSPALRLRYMGQVDFDGNLNAHMRAEFLRDAWMFGKVFSIAFWPIEKAFEYKVMGTLDEPKTKPLYLPKLILFPFHPVQTLKDVFSKRPNEASETNTIPSEPVTK